LTEPARIDAPTRKLSIADKLMLVIMAAIVLVGVARFAVVAQGLAAHKADSPARLSKNPAFVGWWGGRPIPHATGDDYLFAMRERSTLRTLGPILGTVVERQKAQGASITKVLVPKDNSELLGGRTGAVFTTAEGRQATTKWAPVAISAANLTATPLVQRDYDPVLTDSQAKLIESSTRLQTATRHFRVGSAAQSASGVWILYAHPLDADSREFLFVPVEVAPEGARP